MEGAGVVGWLESASAPAPDSAAFEPLFDPGAHEIDFVEKSDVYRFVVSTCITN